VKIHEVKRFGVGLDSGADSLEGERSKVSERLCVGVQNPTPLDIRIMLFGELMHEGTDIVNCHRVLVAFRASLAHDCLDLLFSGRPADAGDEDYSAS
jgi:hypothetical protein